MFSSFPVISAIVFDLPNTSVCVCVCRGTLVIVMQQLVLYREQESDIHVRKSKYSRQAFETVALFLCRFSIRFWFLLLWSAVTFQNPVP